MILRFAKFYKGDDGTAYASTGDGLAFALFSGAEFGFRHVEKLPDGVKEVPPEEWAAARMPTDVEFHVAGEKDEPDPELTPEEKAADEKWRADVRKWKQDRADGVSQMIQAAIEHGAAGFEIEETTTRSYSCPVLLAAVAGFVGAGPAPEDPVKRRHGDRAEMVAGIIDSLKEAIGPMIAVLTRTKAGGAGRAPAPPMPPQPQPPRQPPTPGPAPQAAPTAAKAAEKGPEAGK